MLMLVKQSDDNGSENLWLRELGRGNDKAYKELFVRYYSLLCMLARRYLENSQEAEDAVHDVLCGIWERREKFETIYALKSYLYKAVSNQCLNILKHDKVKVRYISAYEVGEEQVYENRLLELETYELLRQTISGLPEQTRKVYDLVLLGYDNPEIADELGITVDAVKAHRKRGKKVLQEKLYKFLVLCVISCRF